MSAINFEKSLKKWELNDCLNNNGMFWGANKFNTTYLSEWEDKIKKLYYYFR